MSDPAAEFDGPWKEALEQYFQPFIELLFPEIGRGIDWTQPVEFLDKELQQLAPDAANGRGTVDKLAKVLTTQGREEWVLVHVEVQSQHDADLARRMYRYNHRLEDKYGKMPVSVAVLGDAGRAWRPTEFTAGLWGCEVRFTFPITKVVDWSGREEELERSPSPFAPFVLAHLKTVETDSSPADRLTWKLRVVKGLYDRGVGPAEIIRLFRLVDWMMSLPGPQVAQFDADLDRFEKERQMPVITPREQRLLDTGAARGLRDGIEAVLDLRFGVDGVALMARVQQVLDIAFLEQFLRTAKTAPDLDALRTLLPPQSQA